MHYTFLMQKFLDNSRSVTWCITLQVALFRHYAEHILWWRNFWISEKVWNSGEIVFENKLLRHYAFAYFLAHKFLEILRGVQWCGTLENNFLFLAGQSLILILIFFYIYIVALVYNVQRIMVFFLVCIGLHRIMPSSIVCKQKKCPRAFFNVAVPIRN